MHGGLQSELLLRYRAPVRVVSCKFPIIQAVALFPRFGTRPSARMAFIALQEHLSARSDRLVRAEVRVLRALPAQATLADRLVCPVRPARTASLPPALAPDVQQAPTTPVLDKVCLYSVSAWHILKVQGVTNATVCLACLNDTFCARFRCIRDGAVYHLPVRYVQDAGSPSCTAGAVGSYSGGTSRRASLALQETMSVPTLVHLHRLHAEHLWHFVRRSVERKCSYCLCHRLVFCRVLRHLGFLPTRLLRSDRDGANNKVRMLCDCREIPNCCQLIR
jgi:hypothetical protein